MFLKLENYIAKWPCVELTFVLKNNENRTIGQKEHA